MHHVEQENTNVRVEGIFQDHDRRWSTVPGACDPVRHDAAPCHGLRRQDREAHRREFPATPDRRSGHRHGHRRTRAAGAGVLRGTRRPDPRREERDTLARGNAARQPAAVPHGQVARRRPDAGRGRARHAARTGQHRRRMADRLPDRGAAGRLGRGLPAAVPDADVGQRDVPAGRTGATARDPDPRGDDAGQAHGRGLGHHVAQPRT